MDQVTRFNPEIPIAEAVTPPSSWYLDSDFLEREKERVFRTSWQYVGHTGHLQKSGDYFSGNFLDHPFVVVKGEDEEIRAFHNVCRHHAACVAQGSGNTELLVCPYHGWAYRLDGSLRRAPRLGAAKNFKVEEFGLKPLPLALWGPLVFVHFGKPVRTLEQELAGLEEFIDPAELATLPFTKRVDYELDCNWKVFVDNYLDGGYHVEYLHGGLAAQLDLKGYQTIIKERYSVQTCGSGGDGGEVAQDFAERLGKGAAYAWLYPNLMLNRYGDILDINWVIPLDAQRCLTVFDYFFASNCSAEFIEKSLAASHQVQLEDVDICNSVQRGLRSPAYDVGRYAPDIEQGEHHFHSLLHHDLSS